MVLRSPQSAQTTGTVPKEHGILRSARMALMLPLARDLRHSIIVCHANLVDIAKTESSMISNCVMLAISANLAPHHQMIAT
jgi:hypothetical protein